MLMFVQGSAVVITERHDKPRALCPMKRRLDDSRQLSSPEQILWTESKFDGATPGSPEKFRAKEAADALRWKLEQLRSG